MKQAAFIGLLGLMLVGGCAANNGGGETAMVKGLSSEDADRLNANRAKFERSEDPPLNPDTRFAAGRLAESQGGFAQAAEQYQEALKINPRHEPSLYRLSVMQAQMKQYPQAIDTCKRYIAVTQGSAVAYSNLAFCYELAGRPADAELAYKAGVEKDPKCKPCRVNYGLMLARLNRIDQALAQFQAVLTAAEAHYNIASVFEQQGKKDMARAEYRKALELNPNFDEARTRLAALN